MESPAKHDIRNLTDSEDDFGKICQLWQTIFPKWPIDPQRLGRLLYGLPGLHYIHEKGFCLSFLDDGKHGKIAAVGVLPEYRGKGLGIALMETAQAGLRRAACEDGGGGLSLLEIGSLAPRFWPQVPVDFPPEVGQFFLNRGFQKAAEPPRTRDLFRDVRDSAAPPEILEKVSKTNLKFTPWSPELYEECIAKQRANFTWSKIYEILAAHNQYDEVLVALDPDTNEQLGWTLMCSPSAVYNSAFAFIPLVPTGENTGLIAAVGIDEKARGKGVGLALVVKAIENLRERGVDGIFIDSVTIKGFYEKLGFETWWEYEGYVWKGD